MLLKVGTVIPVELDSVSITSDEVVWKEQMETVEVTKDDNSTDKVE